MKTLKVLLASMLLSGCATNPFTQFYRDHTAGASKEEVARRVSPYSGTTKIFTTSDHQKDGATLMQRGYLLIGESSFEGAVKVTEAQITEQGKQVGADMVLYSSSYQGSSQAAVPFVQYNPGTTSTTYNSGTVNANAYGTGGAARGTANYSGYSTTTSPGTYSTTVVPITLHRYAHGATFWRKGRAPTFGVYPDSLPDELRQKLQRNTGALVKIVMDDSPAFRANVLAGDVVTALGDLEITSPKQLIDALPDFAGQEVVVTVVRDGEEKKLKVRMNTKS